MKDEMTRMLCTAIKILDNYPNAYRHPQAHDDMHAIAASAAMACTVADDANAMLMLCETLYVMGREAERSAPTGDDPALDYLRQL